MLVFYAVLSVPCSLVITCWERADFLALLSVMVSDGVFLNSIDSRSLQSSLL